MRTSATLQRPDSGTIQLGEIVCWRSRRNCGSNSGICRKSSDYIPTSPQRRLDHFAELKGVTVRGERRDLVQALLQQTNLYAVRSKKSADSLAG